MSMQQHINSICHATFLGSDKSRQSDRICPEALLQDLLGQWSYPALLIVSQFSQVYQQT